MYIVPKNRILARGRKESVTIIIMKAVDTRYGLIVFLCTSISELRDLPLFDHYSYASAQEINATAHNFRPDHCVLINESLYSKIIQYQYNLLHNQLFVVR